MRETVELLITIPLAEDLLEEIRQVSEFLHITHLPATDAAEIPEEVWAKTEVLYTMHVLPEPQKAPNLRWVQSYLAGVDKDINHPVLLPEKVLFSSMSGANASQVAEHVLTMMLALGHNLPGFASLQHEKTWMQEKGKNYIPREIRGSTVGIVGYGSIGRQVARLVTGMGAQVLAIKRDAMTPVHHGYSAEGLGDPQGDLFTRLYPPEAIRSMAAECDFVVICMPKTSLTSGMIGAEQIAAMKKTAFLVDVSRGGVTDHQALIKALSENKIAGAALDVFPEEPLPKQSELWHLPNVIITPHISGFSPEYSQRANQLLVENLTRYLSGQGLLNLVKQEREY
ncbi:MAG: D-2-hydroxyacid dehydrogenase [Anaerolineales bacterium]|nr:D-2-hydroxyacid dehydrogenase [Anaerolineales bacterium]